MILNSIRFAFFLTAVFLVYWIPLRRSQRLQNLWLLAANAYFLWVWDWRSVAVLYAGALADFGIGWALHAATQPARRRLWLALSLALNIGTLGFFKYCNFFIDSATGMLGALGLDSGLHTLKLFLPLGLSFYTLQRLSYTLDLYRRQIPATRDPVAFLVFSSFFPLVTAGPIERAKRLLPQLAKPRVFDERQAADGLRQILNGLFKKIVIADNLAGPVATIFSEYSRFSGLDLALGAFLFAIQIYADFSGYSDMAIGCGRLLGFRLMRNFNYPYFSRDIGEFWRRWHISLSNWLRDYIYTPLSMKVSLDRRMRRAANILVTFGISGLWHGAQWNFVVWGLLQATGFAPLIWGRAGQYETATVAENRLLPTFTELWQMVATFSYVCFVWIFFAASDLRHALAFVGALFTTSWLAIPHYPVPVLLCLLFLAVEWIQRGQPYPLITAARLPAPLRWGAYCAVILGILVFGSFGEHGFFYAQF